MTNFNTLKEKFKLLQPVLDERTKRLWAATQAQAIGWGGITKAAEATGLSRTTITAGVAELKQNINELGSAATKRIRRSGGGRKSLEEIDPNILTALEALVEPATRGDPQSPLRWTCKSAQRLAEELSKKGYKVGVRKVAYLLRGMNYSLQSNRKSNELKSHPDRNAQFEHINAMVKQFQDKKQPVISVDAKKKELVGDFKNAGREWQPKGKPEKVRVHDFEDKELGKVIPYGVYDVTKNEGCCVVIYTNAYP